VPAAPEAWILSVAKRELLQDARHRRVVADPATVAAVEASTFTVEPDPAGLPDDRLRLLFVCAHPAIDPGIHTALMLQLVLGFDAAQIASVYLTSPTALAQRLVRAKSKIRASGVSFETPGHDELAPRLDAVLEAIYAAYSLGWAGNEAVAFERTEFADESVFLAGLVAQCLPDEPEALGLAALLELCESRHRARRSPEGRFVPLHAQDTALWDRARIVAANALLARAAQAGRPGRFQLEAAIQAAHAQRAFGEAVPWLAIAHLYRGLRHIGPTVGAAIAEAVALAEAGLPARAAEQLDAIDAARVRDHLPYWVARARVAELSGEAATARDHYARAAGLATDASIRSHLLECVERLERRRPT
jgi:RNA polymerase sigma-70 factor (ECF subfamily)